MAYSTEAVWEESLNNRTSQEATMQKVAPRPSAEIENRRAKRLTGSELDAEEVGASRFMGSPL
jgi:hypothetical protein